VPLYQLKQWGKIILLTENVVETKEIEKIINRATEQSPHTKVILKSFEPIIIAQKKLAKETFFESIDFSLIDKDKLKKGIPVNKQMRLLTGGTSFANIVIALASSISHGMPSLAKEMDNFCDLIINQKINLNDWINAYPGNSDAIITSWREEHNIQAKPISFLMSQALRVIFERRASEIVAHLGEFDWDKGYCPICGAFPSLALIEESGGKRFLHCSSCGFDWRFNRIICPYCENEAPEGMDYFYVENKTQEAAFICDKCKKYLVTLYRAGKLFARDMDVSAISLIHLDMIMQDKGYTPMTSCPWNVFS
jgi:FdhE protein